MSVVWRQGTHHEPAAEVERLEAQVHELQERLARAADEISRLHAVHRLVYDHGAASRKGRLPSPPQ